MASPSASDLGDLTDDAFLGRRVRLRQPAAGFRSGMDAVWLAASVPARPGEAVLELGCGAGAALLCLGARVPGLGLHGVEAHPGYAALARGNGVPVVWVADVAEARGLPPVHHVLANPPWFDRATTTPAPDPAREAGQGERAPLAAWTGLARAVLRPGGTLTLVLPAARLPDALAALDRFGSVEVQPLAPRAGRAPKVVLIRSRKGGRAPFRLHHPLAVHAAARHERDGEDLSPWARAVLRDGAALPWGGSADP